MKNSLPAVLDTNVLIRFFTNEPASQAEKVGRLFNSAEPNSLWITDVVFMETTFVLQSVYKLKREKIVDILNTILSSDKFKLNKKVLSEAVSIFSNCSLSIVDCYLAALNRTGKTSSLYSFDKDLLKVDGVTKGEW